MCVQRYFLAGALVGGPAKWELTLLRAFAGVSGLPNQEEGKEMDGL